MGTPHEAIDFDELLQAVVAADAAVPQCALDGTCAPSEPSGDGSGESAPPAHRPAPPPGGRRAAEPASAPECAPE